MGEKVISINEVKPGMKIVKPIIDKTGIVLLKEGIELTEIWIERLKARKIEYVAIDDESSDVIVSSQEDLEKIYKEIDENIDSMFSEVISNSIMQEIARCAKKFHKSRFKVKGQ